MIGCMDQKGCDCIETIAFSCGGRVPAAALFFHERGADYNLPRYVRVGLLYGNSAPKTVTLESVWGFQLGSYDGRDFGYQTETDQTVVVVRPGDGNTVNVTDAAGNVLYTGGGSAGILPRASGMDQKLSVDGVEYRGGINCIADGGALTIVNVVFLDHYLYGVISREMSPTWPEAGSESAGGLRPELCCEQSGQACQPGL